MLVIFEFPDEMFDNKQTVVKALVEQSGLWAMCNRWVSVEGMLPEETPPPAPTKRTRNRKGGVNGSPDR